MFGIGMYFGQDCIQFYCVCVEYGVVVILWEFVFIGINNIDVVVVLCDVFIEDFCVFIDQGEYVVIYYFVVVEFVQVDVLFGLNGVQYIFECFVIEWGLIVFFVVIKVCVGFLVFVVYFYQFVMDEESMLFEIFWIQFLVVYVIDIQIGYVVYGEWVYGYVEIGQCFVDLMWRCVFQQY